MGKLDGIDIRKIVLEMQEFPSKKAIARKKSTATKPECLFFFI